MTTASPLSPEARKILAVLREAGIEANIHEFSQTTRTALDAARALKCDLGQIAKSLVFEGQKTGSPYLVIASGVNRVDEKIIGRIAGEPVALAEPGYVSEKTGFAVGGVPPFGHTAQITTLMDQDLFRHQKIWAAAGTPNAVFPLTPDQLELLTRGEIVKVS